MRIGSKEDAGLLGASRKGHRFQCEKLSQESMNDWILKPGIKGEKDKHWDVHLCYPEKLYVG